MIRVQIYKYVAFTYTWFNLLELSAAIVVILPLGIRSWCRVKRPLFMILPAGENSTNKVVFGITQEQE